MLCATFCTTPYKVILPKTYHQKWVNIFSWLFGSFFTFCDYFDAHQFGFTSGCLTSLCTGVTVVCLSVLLTTTHKVVVMYLLPFSLWMLTEWRYSSRQPDTVTARGVDWVIEHCTALQPAGREWARGCLSTKPLVPICVAGWLCVICTFCSPVPPSSRTVEQWASVIYN